MRIPHGLFNYGRLRFISTADKKRITWMLRVVPNFEHKQMILAILEEVYVQHKFVVDNARFLIKLYKKGRLNL